MAIIEAYSTARKCGLASQSTNTHVHSLEVKKIQGRWRGWIVGLCAWLIRVIVWWCWI